MGVEKGDLLETIKCILLMCTGLLRDYKDEPGYDQGTRLKAITIVTEFMTLLKGSDRE